MTRDRRRRRPVLVLLTLCLSLPAMGQAGSDAMPADFFPLLPWGRSPSPEQADDPARGLPSMAECGFNIAGFVVPELLPKCEQYGLKAIVHPGALGVAKNEWATLAPEAIDARIKTMVETIGDNPALLGYYLVDEPGATLFRGLGAAVKAIRKYAPGKLAYINLFPGYATIGAPDKSQLQTASFTEYLERYVAEVQPQFISYDNYLVQYSQDLLDTARAAGYYRDLFEVRRVALEHGLPFWNIVSSNQIRPITPPPSPANLAFQAYTTLAAGGRGLSWYTYDIGQYGYRPIDLDGHRTVTWGYLQAINRQVRVLGPLMIRLTSTGVGCQPPNPVPDLPPLPGKIVKAVQTFRTGPGREELSTAPVPVMVGEFVDPDGKPYVMLVNLSLSTSARLVPELVADGPLSQASPEDGNWSAVDADGLWLTAGQGVLLRVE